MLVFDVRTSLCVWFCRGGFNLLRCKLPVGGAIISTGGVGRKVALT